MPDGRISQLTALSAEDVAAFDEIELLDKSDVSMSAEGTNKRVQVSGLSFLINTLTLDTERAAFANAITGGYLRLPDGLDADEPDEAGANGCSLQIRCGAGGDFDSGEGEGGSGGGFTIILGAAGEGFEGPAAEGRFVIKKPDGSTILHVGVEGVALYSGVSLSVGGPLTVIGNATFAGNVSVQNTLDTTAYLVDDDGIVSLYRLANATATISFAVPAQIVGCAGTASTTQAFEIPSSWMKNGRPLIIKDEGGQAATRNITVTTEGAETIDGAGSVTISSNYGSLRLYSNGSNWFTF